MPGSTRTSGASSAPATPAQTTPSTKARAAMRRVSRPTISASAGLATMACTRAPAGLRRYHQASKATAANTPAISQAR